jgi:purine-binding chemotaxis protein CheW
MGETNQFLTFSLEGEQYAVSVLKVREVLEYTRITKIPRTASFMKGIINLRGMGVPVIDLRSKFGMEEVAPTKDTSIVVMEVHGAEDKVVIGALADAVQEVVDLEPSNIEPPPRFGTRLATDFILGMGKKDGAFIIILDIDKIFTTEEVSYLNRMDAPAEAVQA